MDDSGTLPAQQMESPVAAVSSFKEFQKFYQKNTELRRKHLQRIRELLAKMYLMRFGGILLRKLRKPTQHGAHRRTQY